MPREASPAGLEWSDEDRARASSGGRQGPPALRDPDEQLATPDGADHDKSVDPASDRPDAARPDAAPAGRAPSSLGSAASAGPSLGAVERSAVALAALPAARVALAEHGPPARSHQPEPSEDAASAALDAGCQEQRGHYARARPEESAILDRTEFGRGGVLQGEESPAKAALRVSLGPPAQLAQALKLARWKPPQQGRLA